MTRILLYTGKGGVGKTSLAAATALLCADRGLRTIVLSTDIAHSLADAFDLPLGPEPTRIAPNLDGQEPDVYYNIARYWRTIQSYVLNRRLLDRPTRRCRRPRHPNPRPGDDRDRVAPANVEGPAT